MLPAPGTRSVGLTPAQVAIGHRTAAVAGMALTTPMEYLADRRGPKQGHFRLA